MDAIKQILSSDTNKTPEKYAELVTPDAVQFVSTYLDTKYNQSEDTDVDSKVDMLLSGTGNELRSMLLAADRIKSTMKDIRSYEDKVRSRSRWYHLLVEIDNIQCNECADANGDITYESHDNPNKQPCDECADLKESSPTRLQIVNAIEEFPSFLMAHFLDPDKSDVGVFAMICSFVIDGKCVCIEYHIPVMGCDPTNIHIVIDGKVVETYNRSSLHGRMIDFYSVPVNFFSHFHLIRDGYFDGVHIASELAAELRQDVDKVNQQTLETENPYDTKPDETDTDTGVILPRPTLKYNSPRDVFVDLYPDRDVTVFDRVDELILEKGDPTFEWLSEAVAHTNKVWSDSLTDYKRRVAEWRDEQCTVSRNKDTRT